MTEVIEVALSTPTQMRSSSGASYTAARNGANRLNAGDATPRVGQMDSGGTWYIYETLLVCVPGLPSTAIIESISVNDIIVTIVSPDDRLDGASGWDLEFLSFTDADLSYGGFVPGANLAGRVMYASPVCTSRVGFTMTNIPITLGNQSFYVLVASQRTRQGNYSGDNEYVEFDTADMTWVIAYRNAVAPYVSTQAASAIASTTAALNGTVSWDGENAITERGFYFGTTSSPSTKLAVAGTTGIYALGVTGLTPGQTYYFRSFARNAVGETLGSVLSFTALAVAPTVSVPSESHAITTLTPTASVTNTGGATVTERGFCIGTSASPRTKTVGSGNDASFTTSFIDLMPGATYYVCSYATNSIGTTYSADVAVTMANPPAWIRRARHRR